MVRQIRNRFKEQLAKGRRAKIKTFSNASDEENCQNLTK